MSLAGNFSQRGQTHDMYQGANITFISILFEVFSPQATSGDIFTMTGEGRLKNPGFIPSSEHLRIYKLQVLTPAISMQIAQQLVC